MVFVLDCVTSYDNPAFYYLILTDSDSLNVVVLHSTQHDAVISGFLRTNFSVSVFSEYLLDNPQECFLESTMQTGTNYRKNMN